MTKKNVGKTDRIIRFFLGSLIIIFGVINQTWWGAIGVGIMIPAIMASDPLYSVIGINTNKK
jgi:hypothetical protein